MAEQAKATTNTKDSANRDQLTDERSTTLEELKAFLRESTHEDGESIACDAEEICVDGKVVGISIEPVDGFGRIVFYPQR